MTLESGRGNLFKGTKIYHKTQQFIYLISFSQTFLIIVDFLIIFCFSTAVALFFSFVLVVKIINTHLNVTQKLT